MSPAKLTEIPDNTIFEHEPLYPPLPPDAIKLFKLMLLEFGKAYHLDNEMTQTELINSMEGCRRKGYLRVVERDGDYKMELTPTGSATAFLEKLKRAKK